MDKFIEVYDDIPFKFQDELENLVLNQKYLDWKFNPNLSGVNDQIIPGLANTFYSEDNVSQFNPNIAFYLFQPLYQMGFQKNIQILKIFEARLFLQTPSPNPQPFLSALHNDLDFNHWVFLYYINDSDGDTIFFNDEGSEIKRISPKKGRIVFFDGSIKHTGSSSSHLRAVLNIDFIGKKLG